MYEFSDEGHAEPEEVLSFEVPLGVEQGSTELILTPDPLLRGYIIEQEASLTPKSEHKLINHDKVHIKSDTHEAPQKVGTWFEVINR